MREIKSLEYREDARFGCWTPVFLITFLIWQIIEGESASLISFKGIGMILIGMVGFVFVTFISLFFVWELRRYLRVPGLIYSVALCISAWYYSKLVFYLFYN